MTNATNEAFERKLASLTVDSMNDAIERGDDGATELAVAWCKRWNGSGKHFLEAVVSDAGYVRLLDTYGCRFGTEGGR